MTHASGGRAPTWTSGRYSVQANLDSGAHVERQGTIFASSADCVSNSPRGFTLGLGKVRAKDERESKGLRPCYGLLRKGVLYWFDGKGEKSKLVRALSTHDADASETPEDEGGLSGFDLVQEDGAWAFRLFLESEEERDLWIESIQRSRISHWKKKCADTEGQLDELMGELDTLRHLDPDEPHRLRELLEHSVMAREASEVELEDMKRKLDAQRATEMALRKERDDAESRASAVEDSLAIASSQAEQTAQALHKSNEEKKCLLMEVNGLKDQVEALTSHASETKTTISSLELARQELEQICSKLNDDLEAVERENKGLQCRLDEEQAELSSKLLALQDTRRELEEEKQRNKELSSEQKALMVQCAHATSKLEAVESEWTAATKENRILQESELTLKSELWKLKSINMEQNTSILRLREESQTWKTKLDRRIATENSRVKELENELAYAKDELEQKKQQFSGTLSEKESELVHLQQAHDNLEALLAAKERAEKRSEALRGTLEGEKEALRQSLVAAEEYSKDAKSKVALMESNMEAAIEESNRVVTLNSRLQEELKEVKEREAQLLYQLNEQKTELAGESHRLVLASERFEEVNTQFRHLQTTLGVLRAKDEVQSKKCEDLALQLQELQQQLQCNERQVKELEGIGNQMEKDIECLTMQVEDKTKIVEDLQAQLDQKCADCNNFENEVISTNERLSLVEGRLHEAEIELSHLRPKEVELEQAKKELSSLSPLPELLSNANTKLETTELERVRLEHETKTMIQKMEEMQEHYTRMKDQLSTEQALRVESQKKLQDEVEHMSASLLHISRSAISGEEASRELDLARSDQARMKEELAKMENTIGVLSASECRLRAEIDAKSKQVESLADSKKALQEMEQKCTSYEKSLLASARERERLEKSVGSLQSKLDGFAKDSTHTHQKLADAKLKIQSLELERTELCERLQHLTMDTSPVARTDKHSSIEQRLEETIEGLRDQLSEKEGDLLSLEAKLNAAQSDLEEERSLRKQAQAYAEKAAVMRAAPTDSQGKMAARAEKLANELADLRLQNSELRESLRESQREVKFHARTERQAERTIADQNEKLVLLEERVSQLKSQSRDADARANGHLEEVGTLRGELGILQDKLQDLHSQYDAKLQTLKDKLETEREKREELEVLLKMHNKEVAAVENLKESWLGQQKKREEEIRNLHRELKAAHSEKADAIARIEGLEHQLQQMHETTAGQLREIDNLKQEQEHFRSKVTKTKQDSERAARNDVQLTQLARLYARESALRRNLHNTLVELKGNIRVYVRVRPLMPSESKKASNVNVPISFPELGIADVCQLLHFKTDSGAIRGTQVKEFDFDRIFTPLDGQKVVFEEIAPYVASVMDGYNTCIFCYGATGSGKTHSMIGPDGEPGIFPRAVQAIFRGMTKVKSGKTSPGTSVVVYGSLMEVYNEQLRDLLVPKEQQSPLELQTTKDGSIMPSGLVKQRMYAVSDALTLLETGTKNRVTEPTKLNLHSSRSHLILLLQVVAYHHGDKFKGKLYLVDLAGSERLKRSQSTGNRLEETKQINKSLSALGDVISALSSNSSHVPYRNSKLTHVLMDCLRPHAKCVMIANVSPALEDTTETLNTLNFANRAKSVELGRAITYKERVEEEASRKAQVVSKWKKAVSSAKIKNVAYDSE